VIVGGESLVSPAGGVGGGRHRACRWAVPGAVGPAGTVASAVGDPRSGKIVLDLAVAVALGEDCAADVAVLRAQPGVFGLVASDPTVSRLVATLAWDVDAALGAIGSARAVARQRVWGEPDPRCRRSGNSLPGRSRNSLVARG